MKIDVSRKFEFCAGHRVYKHANKCANMHGHNYTLIVYATSSKLNELGMVIDFADLKKRIKPWIDENWDHTFLIYEKDTELLEIEKIAPKNKPWFICPFNPTAEEMASYLLKTILPKLMEGTGIEISRVELFETENGRVVVHNN